jgi:hypothetical protein
MREVAILPALAAGRRLAAICANVRSPNMRPKRPIHVSIDQVRVTREGNEATIDHADASAPTVHMTIGPGISSMSDADIVAMYNGILDAQWALLQEWDKTVVEEPPGEPQISSAESALSESKRNPVRTQPSSRLG